MVYVLVGERMSRDVEANVWHDALELATRFGWHPRGTLRGRGWGGCYVAPCGQLVAAVDAEAMALALESALDDLPDHDPAAGSGTAGANLLERLGGSRKSGVSSVIALLRSGAFTIHGRCDRCD